MAEQHALLSASSAYRWLNCPGSVTLTKDLPDTAGEAAQEGTLAHSICELMLKKQYLEPMSPRTYKSRLKKLQEHPLYCADMLEGAQLYLDTVNEIYLERKDRPHIAVEKQVSYSQYAPEGFGTSDCILIGGGILDIIDYKFGKGHPVGAEDNPQLKLYALGALTEYGLFYPIDRVRLTIVQPRAGGVSQWSVPRSALEDWGDRIKPVAVSAFDGTGECHPGDWCDKSFCKIRATCRARTDSMLKSDFAGKYGELPPELSDAEIGQILTEAQNLAAWVSQLEDYTLKALLGGRSIPGWKAVEGRSNRRITDTDKAFAILTGNGYDEALLYERKPLGLTALESLVGKKKLGTLISEYIEKPRGKPTLAPESDHREPYSTIADDFGDDIPNS